MLTVQVVPGLVAREASEQLVKFMKEVVEKQLCADMREEFHRIIYNVLKEWDTLD